VKALLAVALVYSFVFVIGKVVDSKYAYSCPSLTVTVLGGDTLSSITERYCEGHTLQAAFDLADKRGSSFIQVGDIITLGN